MFSRAIARRQARQALAAPLLRPCTTRFISQDTTTTGLTADVLESLTTAAALDQVPSAPDTSSTRVRRPRASDTVPDSWKEYRRAQNLTKSIGSDVKSAYIPSELVTNPPHPRDITLELLLASQTHMGHHRSRWNPANSRYIYGVRDNVHIISLETTASHLRRAARVVEEVAFHGGLVLFVGTRPGQMDIVTKAAGRAGGCHLYTKWTPGAITNRDFILRDREVVFFDEHDKSVSGFDSHVMDRRPLVPDLVVCLNPMENKTLLNECGLATVPTIGIIDTDADPTWVTYAIPANDDSLRSTSLIGGILGRAGQEGQKRRKEAAAAGQVPWENPVEVDRYIEKTRQRHREAMKVWQEDMQALEESKTANPERLLDLKRADGGEKRAVTSAASRASVMDL
ncbi:hypothetical protein ACHAQA_006357 [Verticillium albo-atrum]